MQALVGCPAGRSRFQLSISSLFVLCFMRTDQKAGEFAERAGKKKKAAAFVHPMCAWYSSSIVGAHRVERNSVSSCVQFQRKTCMRVQVYVFFKNFTRKSESVGRKYCFLGDRSRSTDRPVRVHVSFAKKAMAGPDGSCHALYVSRSVDRAWQKALPCLCVYMHVVYTCIVSGQDIRPV